MLIETLTPELASGPRSVCACSDSETCLIVQVLPQLAVQKASHPRPDALDQAELLFDLPLLVWLATGWFPGPSRLLRHREKCTL
jgi:hypothetical protein